MVKAQIDIEDETNHVLNIVKAQYALNDKSQAIDKVVEIYFKECMEPELRPEFVKKMMKRQKEKSIKVKDFKKRYGLD